MTVTLVDASHTPDHSTTDSRVSEAGSAKIPLKARWSLYWQRAILTVRYWFRLPIDDIKEQRLEAQIDGLIALNQKAFETIQTLVNVSNNMQLRLLMYEQNIPRMRELKREFDRQQAVAHASKNGNAEDLANGVVKPSLILPLNS